ncbi:TPA: hypothetical protein P0E23_005309 [Vibrio harveyi]|nr:hypothetical protein [Vibrio harveyi]
MKEEVQKRIAICHEILEKSVGWSLWGNTRDKFNDLIDEISKLEQRLDESDKSKDIIGIKAEVIKLESACKSFRTYRMMFPYVIYSYLGFFALFIVFRFFDIPKFINGTLGVEAPEKLISFGVSGAFVYLATSLISKSSDTGALGPITDFAFRLLLAVVVPIILVALFFTQDGQLSEFTLTPELLSFGVGYSANLLTQILNKLVEKIATMVKAL